MTNGNGIAERDLAHQVLVANSYMSRYSLEREQTLGALSSKFFDGSRDIYSVAGYPTALSVESYLGRYQRDALAYRIVTAAPDDTWRKPFKMLDGDVLEDAVSDTEFVNAWNEFIQFDTLDGDLLDDSRRSLWHYFFEADRQAGIGQYSVMVLGFNDGLPLDQPIKRNRGNKLLYVNVLNEYYAKVYPSSLIADPNSPRFGLPELYHINYGTQLGIVPVHYSRIIHVAEGGVLYGKPRLEAVYNRLIDIEKLLSASGEAGWRSITRKIIISSRDGYQLSEGTVTTDKISDMIHGLRDVVELEGADVNVVSGESIDPTGALTQQLSMVSAGTDIPVRILIGSERGSLASTQDEKHWNDNIQARRTNFVEPVIVRQFIKRMIYAGLLPMPSSRNYCLDWPSLFEADDATQSQTFLTYTQGVAQLAGAGVDRIVKPQQVVKYFVRGLPADALPTEQELTALDEAAAQKQQDAIELAKANQPQTTPADGGEPINMAMTGNSFRNELKRFKAWCMAKSNWFTANSEPDVTKFESEIFDDETKKEIWDGMIMDHLKESEPSVNSYSPTEQQAVFEAAARLVAGGA